MCTYLLNLITKHTTLLQVSISLPCEFYRFVESKFEEIFKKHARSHRNALTYKELLQLLKSNRDPGDFGGWFVFFIFYFTELYILLTNY